MKKLTAFFSQIIFIFSVSALPSVKTGNSEINRLVLLAQEEVQKNIRTDGTFCAGAKWPTAWTRDMSYAIDLSLSFLFPETVEKSLESRIENKNVLQDTGSGGSYPVSTDRITWITAAYDYSLVKQSPEYFKKIYEVASNTLEKDYNVNYDGANGLFRGESSFLDWREQTYPRWATNEYIAESYALGTNMMYYSALAKTVLLSRKTGAPEEETKLWESRADSLKDSILKNFWLPEKKYFAALLLKDMDTFTYEGYETLGESLGVILEISPEDSYRNVTGAVKPQPYGLSVVAPQLTGVPPYHNDAVWPFVQGYRIMACKKAKDAFNAQKEFNTMIQAAKKFGTFKENYVASDFSPDTQINSDRQLWSDAGFLACIYRILFGINFTEDGISISPFVFERNDSPLELKNLAFAGNTISLTVKGFGDTIKSFTVNGKSVSTDYVIPYGNKENYSVQIELSESEDFKDSFKADKQVKPWFDAAAFAPAVPNTRVDCVGKTTEVAFKPKNNGGWKITAGGTSEITKKNEIVLKPSDTVILTKAFALPENYSESSCIPLFPSKTVRAENTANTKLYEAEKAEFNGGSIAQDDNSYSDDDKGKTAKLSEELLKTEANASCYVKDFGKTEGEYIEFTVQAKKSGNYAVDFRFKNGHGPINTGEKCAVLAVSCDGKLLRRLAFPQQGSWSSWSFTAPETIYLEKGSHKLRLYTDRWCRTQHDSLNSVHIDLMRVAHIK